ncbi:hypothetical protein, partial [Streptomyces sp. AS02]|uniref:hypothetical protein n=1 Tax=Streptomyces sp. AS02 TaxID=2938946 RepID=UPI002020325B
SPSHHDQKTVITGPDLPEHGLVQHPLRTVPQGEFGDSSPLTPATVTVILAGGGVFLAHRPARPPTHLP